MLELCAPSYVDASSLLQNDMRFPGQRTVYTAWAAAALSPRQTESTALESATANGAADRLLVAFFIVVWHALPTVPAIHGSVSQQPAHIMAVYMGLSATHSRFANTGVVLSLYASLAEDVLEWEARHRRRVIIWCTSATPSVFHALKLVTKDANPKHDGSYNEAEVPYALAVQQYLHYTRKLMDAPTFVSNDHHSSNHPFRLAGAGLAEYSAAERRRIIKLKQKHPMILFDKLDVDESRRDRVLFLCRSPTSQRYPDAICSASGQVEQTTYARL